jgi:hypothetical protein
MTDKNIRDFELLIATNILPEFARYRKAQNRFRRDVQSLEKACTEAAIAAPGNRNMAAAMLIEFAESLAALDRAIGSMEPGLKGIPTFPADELK